MDFVKKATDGLKGKESSSTQNNAGDQDYADKGMS